MGTAADKLNLLLDTKRNLRAAISRMGIDVPEDLPFSSYPDLLTEFHPISIVNIATSDFIGFKDLAANIGDTVNFEASDDHDIFDLVFEADILDPVLFEASEDHDWVDGLDLVLKTPNVSIKDLLNFYHDYPYKFMHPSIDPTVDSSISLNEELSSIAPTRPYNGDGVSFGDVASIEIIPQA
jgi:hypothetical protein